MDANDVIARLERDKENCTSFAEINRLDYIIKMVGRGMDYNRKVHETFVMTKLAVMHKLEKDGLMTPEIDKAINEVHKL